MSFAGRLSFISIVDVLCKGIMGGYTPPYTREDSITMVHTHIAVGGVMPPTFAHMRGVT